MTCTLNTASHDGQNVRWYGATGIGGRYHRLALCAGCAAASPSWTLDRRQDPERESKSAADRKFVPRWLANLQAKDYSGAVR